WSNTAAGESHLPRRSVCAPAAMAIFIVEQTETPAISEDWTMFFSLWPHSIGRKRSCKRQTRGRDGSRPSRFRALLELEALETRDLPSASIGADVLHSSPSGQPPGVITNVTAQARLLNAGSEADVQALATARAFIDSWTPPGERPGREAPQS